MQRLPPAAVRNLTEFRLLQKLDAPRKVQNFLDTIPINFERGGETCMSPLRTLRRNRAHCMEGALLAALTLWMHGRPPLIMDLKTSADDVDHLVAVFKVGRHWGGITKTNHSVLRYREPVYRDLRELAMSFFHEYFLDNGKKTLRAYSAPFDLRDWDDAWMTSPNDLWELETAIDESRHWNILSPRRIAGLRRADAIEIRAGRLKEW
jgi:hypothetical protein